MMDQNARHTQKQAGRGIKLCDNQSPSNKKASEGKKLKTGTQWPDHVDQNNRQTKEDKNINTDNNRTQEDKTTN